MARYIARPDSWVSPIEETGTLQNASSGVIEVSTEEVNNTGIKLGSSQMLSFSGTIYVRSVGNNSCAFTTVPFKATGKGGGGGTSYELPTASSSIKGGVKIGEGLSMNGEVLNVSLEAPKASVQRVAGGASVTMEDSTGTSSAIIFDGQTPTILFTDNHDGTYTLQSRLGQDIQQVVVHDGVQGAKGDDGESVDVSIDNSVLGQHTLTFTTGVVEKSVVVKDGETENWLSGKAYTVGKLVIYGSNIYQCITANSDNTFDSEKWLLIGSYPTYSVNESVIGTWTNDQTLYQKTYIATTPSVLNTFVKLFDLDSSVGVVVGIESTCTNIVTGISDINAIADIDAVKVVAFDGGVYCKVYGNQQANVPIFITIKYTKSA